MCSRCGGVYDADMLRAFDRVFRDRGEKARLLPEPPLAGDIPPVLSDREIIEFVAHARIGERFPRGLWMNDIYEAMRREGFPVGPGEIVDVVYASAWALEWLREHPEGKD